MKRTFITKRELNSPDNSNFAVAIDKMLEIEYGECDKTKRKKYNGGLITCYVAEFFTWEALGFEVYPNLDTGKIEGMAIGKTEIYNRHKDGDLTFIEMRTLLIKEMKAKMKKIKAKKQKVKASNKLKKEADKKINETQAVAKPTKDIKKTLKQINDQICFLTKGSGRFIIVNTKGSFLDNKGKSAKQNVNIGIYGTLAQAKTFIKKNKIKQISIVKV